MIEARGNLWDWEKSSLLVIPTNIGWKADGRNVMGAGLAKEAAARWHGLAEWYGKFCCEHREDTPVVRYEWSPLILFPVKPMSKLGPAMSWRLFASLELIERSAIQLSRWFEETEWKDSIAVPAVGCGNGRLRETDVIPVLEKHLVDDRFILVRREDESKTVQA